MKTIKIGTRGSLLAIAQAKSVADLLAAKHSEFKFELAEITTKGDTDTKSALQNMGGVGVFTKKIETKLLDRAIDIAVHSAKDLPSSMTDGLAIGAVPIRGSIEDVWISKHGKNLKQIESNSVVGTGSPRRQAMLVRLRPDLKVKDIRGNVQTRIAKLDDDDYDALIMARAGLERTGLKDRVTEVLSVDDFLPAPGQGALVAQIRSDDGEMAGLVNSIDDANSHRCLDIERLLLYKLNAGCSAAVGGLAVIENGDLTLKAAVLDKAGRKNLSASGRSSKAADDEMMVDGVVNDLFSQGARALIEK
jgi:hydroxymethylbilane synthase